MIEVRLDLFRRLVESIISLIFSSIGPFPNSDALKQHLATCAHPVYTCTSCSRFFSCQAHLEQHLDAGGAHNYLIRLEYVVSGTRERLSR